jgi:hypothetical protein
MAVPTARELYDEVQRIIDDTSYDFTDILAYFNKGLNELARKFALPDLEHSEDVIIGVATLTATTISFTNATSTIADSGSALLSSGFHVGETITITGAGDATNNQTTTISSIESDGSAMVVAGTLADEAVGESVTIVNSGPNNIPLPATYHKDLFHAWSASQEDGVNIFSTYRSMLEYFADNMDDSGDVDGFTIFGGRLYFQPIPASIDTITLYFLKKHTALSERTDQPELPEDLAEDLLVNFACVQAFSKIEQDVDGQSVNTIKHRGFYEEAKKELSLKTQRFVKPTVRTKPVWL